MKIPKVMAVVGATGVLAAAGVATAGAASAAGPCYAYTTGASAHAYCTEPYFVEVVYRCYDPNHASYTTVRYGPAVRSGYPSNPYPESVGTCSPGWSASLSGQGWATV